MADEKNAKCVYKISYIRRNGNWNFLRTSIKMLRGTIYTSICKLSILNFNESRKLWTKHTSTLLRESTYEHFSLYFVYSSRCVKCAGPHLAKNCAQPKDVDFNPRVILNIQSLLISFSISFQVIILRKQPYASQDRSYSATVAHTPLFEYNQLYLS